jgi:anaerobic magnesium-protoporphyrin IX monomethyl ester cyclase
MAKHAVILGVYPQEQELKYFEKMPPLGMLWVCGELRKQGYEIDFLDQQVDDRDVGKIAEERQPLLALIGGTSHTRFDSFEIAARIKRTSPRTIVVYGGPHATFTAEDTLEHVPTIDLIAHGEGEETACEIAAWAEAGASTDRLSSIRGISYRDGDTTTHTESRPLMKDLDSLGPPPRDLVPFDRYMTKMEYLGIPGTSVMTARGCPIGCTFCSASAMFGSTYRARSVSLVVDEVEALIRDHGMRGFKIFDSTFTLTRRHAVDFCAELTRRGIQLPWECEIRVGSVDPPLLETMRRAGCYYLDLGIEAGSQRVLDECIHKKIRLSEAEEVLRWAKDLGYLTKVFFTLGHPGESYAEARETNRFIWRNRKYIRLVGYHAGVKVYPGTIVEDFARESGLLPDGFRWSAPYRNEANRKLFRPVDNIPILLQEKLGLPELRRLRIGFVLRRSTSPRFILEKLGRIFRGRSLGSYFGIIGHGLRGAAPPTSSIQPKNARGSTPPLP